MSAVIHTTRLIRQNFYKNEINRTEMYQRYIYKLHDLHVSAENYVEAAFTLRLHADQLEWSTRVLHADLRFPVQCEWQRKEQLLNLMVDYLDRGKCWEAGIPLLKELAEKHETKIYDYNKLSEVLRTMARFYDQIMTQLRPEPEYFRVGFYGQGFPLFVRVGPLVRQEHPAFGLRSYLIHITVTYRHAHCSTSRLLSISNMKLLFIFSFSVESF